MPTANEVTALAVADDPANDKITLPTDSFDDFCIIRFVYNTTDGTSTETDILTSFETTGTQQTNNQVVSLYRSGAYFMDGLHYFPVKTYTEKILDCYGLALDGENNLLVSDSANGLILKVFNPDK